jgi:hypothetical protein
MEKPTDSQQDIAVLMLIEASGPSRAVIAQILSTFREVLDDGTVMGVRWTAVVQPKGRHLSQVGVFAALRAHNEHDLRERRQRIHDTLARVREKIGAAKQDQDPPNALYASPPEQPPEEPPGELEVETFYRGGETEEMGQNGLP